MYILSIEHQVVNYEGWKKAFDSDPMDRRQAGVRHYRILRLVDQPEHVVIELELATLVEANALLSKLKMLWVQIEGKVIRDVKTRIFAIAEVTSL